MYDKLQNISNRIFCVYGKMGDIICENNLQKTKFNQYLSDTLREIGGFERVIFYLSSRGMRTYDKESAQLLVGSNMDNFNDLEVVDFFDEDEDLVFDRELPNQENQDKACSYCARLSDEDFIKLMEYLLIDSSKRSVIIFESIADFIRANENCDAQYNATLHYLLSDSLDDNGNAVVFLAMNQNIYQIYSYVSNNEVLRSSLFYEDSQILLPKESSFIEICDPGIDEIKNLLEHYRVYGNAKKQYLEYSVSRLADLAYLLHKYANIAGKASLNDINSQLRGYMSQKEETRIHLDENSLAQIYHFIDKQRTPMEELEALKNAYAVCKRIHAIELKNRKNRNAFNKHELHRFLKDGYEKQAHARFMIVGHQKSNRSKIAACIADYLFYAGEVLYNQHLFIGKKEWETFSCSNIEVKMKEIVELGKKRVMILDDVDVLVERPDAEELLPMFRSCLRKYLAENHAINLIFVVNPSRYDTVFPEDAFVEFGIKERNVFHLENHKKDMEESDKIPRRYKRGR